MIYKQYMRKIHLHFCDETSALDRAPRGDIYQKSIYTDPSPSPLQCKKESERRGWEELDLDLDRVQPPGLLYIPFLVNALLTGRQVAIPFSTIFET